MRQQDSIYGFGLGKYGDSPRFLLKNPKMETTVESQVSKSAKPGAPSGLFPTDILKEDSRYTRAGRCGPSATTDFIHPCGTQLGTRVFLSVV